MKTKWERRDWLRFAAIGSVVPATAHVPVTAQTPPANDDLAAAKSAQQSNRAALEKVKLDMATEPAFSFKA